MSTQNTTAPNTPDRSLIARFVVAIKHAIHYLHGAPTASVGDIVYFSTLKDVYEFKSYTGRVLGIQTPALGEDNYWWYKIETTTAARENRLNTEIPDVYWFREDRVTASEADAPSPDELAEAKLQTYPQLISVDQLSEYVETALQDLGMNASVTINPETDTISAVLSSGQPIAEQPTAPVQPRASVDSNPQPGATDAEVAAAIEEIEENDPPGQQVQLNLEDDPEEVSVDAEPVPTESEPPTPESEPTNAEPESSDTFEDEIFGIGNGPGPSTDSPSNEKTPAPSPEQNP
jgi:hypothetical protein